MLPLSPQVFAILAGLIEEKAGLHYRLQDLDLVRDKISTRAEQAGFESLLDYYYFLRYDPGAAAELDALVEALVVHETYFFREPQQLEVLLDSLLAPKLQRGGEVRVWCAACATGEEPLTVAMMAADRGVLQRMRIVASDVSSRALQKARAGQFSPRAARALPPGVEGRWLRRQGDRFAVQPGLLPAIEWRRINLLDRDAVRGAGCFDAILVRNVLIYFSDDTVRRVISSLNEALVPQGHLLVGASESLLRYGTSLACVEQGGAFFYRRTG